MGSFSRRSSIQCDEISCIRDHLSSVLSELQIIIPKPDRNGVYIAESQRCKSLGLYILLFFTCEFASFNPLVSDVCWYVCWVFAFSYASASGRLGYWNLLLGLSHKKFLVVTGQHMYLCQLVYTSWCPAVLGRRPSASHHYKSPRLGGGTRK